MENFFCCPHCGNRDIQATTETNTTTKGSNFSAGKGCLGYLLFGPLGILCGLCGSHQQTVSTNTTYWHCSKCGKKFRNPDENIEDYEKQKNTFKITMIVTFIIAAIILFFICNEHLLFFLLGVIGEVLMLLLAFNSYNKFIEAEIEKAYEQKESMKKFTEKSEEKEANKAPELIEEKTKITYTTPIPSVEKEQPVNTAEDAEKTGPAKPSLSPVKVHPNSDGYVFCPMCGTKQLANRKICFKCEVPFMTEPAAPSHHCANCGYSEEYGEFCPKCGSNSKILNIQK